MLVFLDTTGAVTATAPSTTGRNSAAMSTIYIVAPISGAATLSLSFRLPNGDEVNPALADTVHNAVEILKGVPLPDNQRVWSYAIPSSVTRIAGTVTYTITTHTESMTGTGSGTFYVTPATTKTAPSAPTDDDAWADLLAKLSELYAVDETILGNDSVTKLDGTTLTTVTALLADLVALIGKDGAESPIGGATTITTLLDWVKDEVLRLSAAIGSGSIPFAETITEAINALNEMKVSKTNAPSYIYGTDANGNTTALPYSVGVEYDGHGNATSIPLRDNSGHIKTADPTAVDDAVSLGYYNREVGAITDGLRELDNIVKGRSRALVFDNWENALVAISSKGAEELQIGDAILIRDLGAPDAWISGIAPNYDPYLGGNGVTNPFGDNALSFVVGWYAISPLESPKVNLDEYAKEDDLARLKKEVANLRADIPPEYFSTDSSVAYRKSVPLTALPFAEVQEVGGMSYAVDGAIKSAAVSAIESVGVNALDLTPALNECLRDNGDGTYTLTKTASGRFSGSTPFFAKEGQIIHSGMEIVATNIDGLTSLPMQCLDASGAANGASFSLDSASVKGYAIGADTYFVRTYLKDSYSVGSYVTFRAPIVQLQEYYGATPKPYAPYKKRTYSIPAEVQALDGWGLGVNETYHNRIDWEKKQYRQEVRKIVLDGTAGLSYSNARFMMYDILNVASSKGYTTPCICNEFAYNKNVSGDSNREDGITTGGNMVLIRDARFTTAASFNAYLAERKAAGDPVVLIYALATPIITDISHILPDDNLIEVEGGGTITAVNENELDAPTKIEYQLKEATA